MSTLALVENTQDQPGDEQQQQPPNKFKYLEFLGPAGEDYLNAICQQILPAALWRTWRAAVAFQPPGKPCFVSPDKIAEVTKPGVRKIYLDLQKLEGRHLLQTMAFMYQRTLDDGTVTQRAVTAKNFEGLYDLAHEYHLWSESPLGRALPPERVSVEFIKAAPDLMKKLIRFDNYRRLLLCKKPGRKPKPQEEDTWYDGTFDGQAEYALSPAPVCGTPDPKVNLYLNTLSNEDSPKRISNDPASNDFTNKDSSDSENPSKRGGASAKTNACSRERGCSQRGYTKEQKSEKETAHSDSPPLPPTRTNPTNPNPAVSIKSGAEQSARRESAELEPNVVMARRAMALAQGKQPGRTKRKYAGDGKPRPRPNEMVSSFINEFGPVLDDQNKNGSITGTLRTAQAAGLEQDIDILMCLVRAYVVARTTKKVRKTRMALFNKMFRVFAEAWAAGNFHYTEADLITDIAEDERLRNWVMERGLQPEVPDYVATAQGEEPVEAEIIGDGDQEATTIGEAGASSPGGEEGSEHMRTSGVHLTRHIRTAEEKEARKAYTLKVRKELRKAGAAGSEGMMVDTEHPCGCPLYWETENNWRWKCALCSPHAGWGEEVRELIASILEQ
jgi:hypothetical protein